MGIKIGPASLDCVRIVELLHEQLRTLCLEQCLVYNEVCISVSSFVIIAVVRIKYQQAKTSPSVYFMLEA